MIAAFKTSAAILMTGFVLAFAYSILSYTLCPLPDIDAANAIGLGLAFSLCVLMWLSILNLAIAAMAFIAAPLFLLAPFAVALKSLVRAIFTRSTRVSQRALIDQLYPQPDPFRLRIHAST